MRVLKAPFSHTSAWPFAPAWPLAPASPLWQLGPQARTRLDEVAAGVGAVVDRSALNQAGYNRERQLFFVDAGCENWTAYRSLLNGYGKTLPAGSCYSVGAGGHITGGGYRTLPTGRTQPCHVVDIGLELAGHAPACIPFTLGRICRLNVDAS